ncbi:MAG: hypothetical protein ACRC5A_16430 [Enterobacteriaceae bacterium]
MRSVCVSLTLFFTLITVAEISYATDSTDPTLPSFLSVSKAGDLTAVSWPTSWQGADKATISWNVYSQDIPYSVVYVNRQQPPATDTLASVACDHCAVNPGEAKTYQNLLPDNLQRATLVGFYGAGQDEGKILVLAMSHIAGDDTHSPQFNLYFNIANARNFTSHPPYMEKSQWYLLQSVHSEFEPTNSSYIFCTYAVSDAQSKRVMLLLTSNGHFTDCRSGTGTVVGNINFQVK